MESPVAEPSVPGRAESDGRRGLEDLEQRKRALLNRIAHELATPLTPLLVQLHLLRGGSLGPLTEAQERALLQMERNVRRLGGILAEVVGLCKVHAAGLAMRLDRVDAAKVLVASVAAFRPAAATAGVRLRVARATGPLPVLGDSALLSEAFHHLLRNAIALTPPGGAVHVGASEEHGRAVVTVRHTGSTMPARELARLLEGTLPGASSSGLLGMSLPICRAIVGLHGGALDCVQSPRHRGPAMRLRLPLRATPGLPSAEPVQDPAPPPSA